MSPLLESRGATVLVLAAGLALVGLGTMPESPQNAGQPDPVRTASAPLPVSTGFGTADSNGRMIAVTGVDVTGGSILYLVDTQSLHMSVYTAQGGTSSTSNLKWVGARNIAHDFEVNGFNDKSDFSYTALDEKIREKGANAASDKPH